MPASNHAMIAENLTVGIPLYNSAEFIRESLESIINQTVLPKKIIIIDDGSTDGGLTFVDDIIKRHDNIKVIKQSNMGLTKTLNKMLEICETPYLVRQDADDVSLPNRLALTCNTIYTNPNAAVIYGEARYYANGMPGLRFRSTIGTPEVLKEITRQGKLLSICHPSTTLHIRHVRDVGGYRFGLHAEDVDLWWRLALKHPIAYNPNDFVMYRANSKSVSNSNIKSQLISTSYIQYLLLSELLKLKPRDIEEIAAILQSIIGKSYIEYRSKMKQANLYLDSGDRMAAAYALLAAALARPIDFAQRLTESRVNWHKSNKIHNSFPVEKFIQYSKELWGVEL
ncbi:glycosyltransferase family 2 protein [Deinococcus daejeonensis]|uniref:Glycosyltransferase 2-like domain-containing protein n=1 Tax=Deinococcus daejeonensis TaxID=1007098 RepID=A0ABQ2J3F7_9DEIO|nr:glycosyltransferase [Deinococcus daejeonensis]GGN38151.1 hypothetical protein GCM10010842_20750 [Deinococcus daejeonensis]